MSTWPIITKPPKAQLVGEPQQPPSGVVGIARERGEGGFWGRVAFQDATIPWRYAFQQQQRIIDPSAFGGGDVVCFDQAQDEQSNGAPIGRNDGSTFTTPPGQRSVWNIGAEGAPDPSGGHTPGGTVLNWADEINHCQSVPIGALVWIRGGGTYNDPSTALVRDDYTFQWSGPIWAMIVGAHLPDSSDCTPKDNQYQWVEYYRQRATGNPQKMQWAPAVNGRTSVPASASVAVGPLQYPAREVNGNAAVPAGTIVRLWQSNVTAYNSDASVYDQEWLFEYNAPIEGRGQLTANLYGCESASAVFITYDSCGNQTSADSFTVYDPQNKVVGWLEFQVDSNGIPFVPSGTCFDWKLQPDTGHYEINSFGACCVPNPSGSGQTPGSQPLECGVPCPPESGTGCSVLIACYGSGGGLPTMNWEPVATGSKLGQTVTLFTAPLTALGNQGTLEFEDGILVGSSPAT